MTDDFEKEINEHLVEVGESLETSHYQDGRYTISFINNSPGLVVRADTPEEADNAIRKILPVFKRFRQAVEIASEKKAEAVAEENGLQANCETCGTPMVYKTGTTKTGKQWKALMCPHSKKDQPGHEPVWL